LQEQEGLSILPRLPHSPSWHIICTFTHSHEVATLSTSSWRIRHARTSITLPELGLIAGTRVVLGTGLGLLVADRWSDEQRRAVGWAFLLLGALTTIPLAFEVLGKQQTPVQLTDIGA
jgi:hypothetical protein